MQSILIVDDLESIHEMLDAVIQPIGYQTAFATNGEMALQKIRQEKFDIVLTDINMKPMDGLELLRQIRELDPQAIVIMMSGYANVDNAMQSLKLGAFDFLTKPFKVDQLMQAITRASSEHKNRLSSQESSDVVEVSSILSGDSEAVNLLKSQIARQSQSTAPLLLVGEPGSQPGSIAKSIHESAEQTDGPLVTIDASQYAEADFRAAILTPDNTPSELIASAQGGTLLILNVDKVPFADQIPLANLIKDLKGQTRIICATTTDLEKLMESGSFQDALYFRISTSTLEVPSLRDRSEDIVAIAMAYLSKKGYGNLSLGDRANSVAQAYRWPGNYTEFYEVMDAAAAQSDGNVIHAEAFPEKLTDTSSWPTLDEYLGEQSVRYQAQVLRACQGDTQKAASILGCDPATLGS